ncbi:hypothetical protein [Profundibacter sp.]
MLSKIGDHTGTLIAKRNYGPAEVGAGLIIAEPGKHLGAITVMYKREDGFDTDYRNEFWAKFLPDGSLDKNPKGMSHEPCGQDGQRHGQGLYRLSFGC